MKTLGPKFGARLKDVLAVLESYDATILAADLKEFGSVELEGLGGTFPLEAADILVRQMAPEGWSGVADRGTQVALDIRITEDLAREGMARDVVRQVQELRKSAKLELEDRIALHLRTDSEALGKAIEAHRAYITAETLATHWTHEPLNGDAHAANVKVDGQPLTVQLRKTPRQQPESPATEK